jgi:hypothetical protein
MDHRQTQPSAEFARQRRFAGPATTQNDDAFHFNADVSWGRDAPVVF